MSKEPFISVIIPTRTIGYYLIFENLPAFEKVRYEHFEVIVLPNENDPYDLTLLKTYPWLKIIPTHQVTRPAEKRDIGAKAAKGDIIAFIDDDAFPTPNWLQKAVEVFNGHAAVCGPGALPKTADFWEKASDAVLRTWVGSGGYSYRFVKGKKKLVDDYPSMNFLIKKPIFKKLGGFHSEYWPGEDSKLCEDLVYKEKQTILYHPDVLIYHHRRKDLKGYLKQHGNYGFHRGAFFAHGDKNSRRPGYVVPSFFLTYLISLIIFALLGANGSVLKIASIPLVLYVLMAGYLFIKTLFAFRNLKVALGSVVVLFLTHVVYGILFVKGFFMGLMKKEKIYGSF